MPTKDALPTAFFAVDFGNKLRAAFLECTGIGSKTEVVEATSTSEKGENLTQKVPGRTTYTNLTLKRGVTDSLEMWEWRQKVIDGDIDGARTNATVTLYDKKGKPRARWNFEKVWPCRLMGPTLSSTSKDFAVAEVELTYESFQRVKV